MAKAPCGGSISMGLRIKAVHEPLKLWEMERYHQPQPRGLAFPESIMAQLIVNTFSSSCPLRLSARTGAFHAPKGGPTPPGDATDPTWQNGHAPHFAGLAEK